MCEHVNFLGLGGRKDWQLMGIIRREDYAFVTNNRTDFAALYAREELHAGLVIILPNVPPARQEGVIPSGFVACRLPESDEPCHLGRMLWP